MDPEMIGAELMKNPKFMEIFQKAMGDEKIPDDKDPNREEWLKKLQANLQKQSKEEAKKNLETPVTDESGTWMYVVPEPGICLKTTTKAGMKIFINICQHNRVPEPIPMPEEDQSDEVKFRIPLSCGEGRKEYDKKKCPCKAYDVIVNPASIKKCTEDNEFRLFLASLCIHYVKEKSEPDMLVNEFKQMNFKCKGIPDPHRIRLSSDLNSKLDNAMQGEIKLPENNNKATTPIMQGGNESRKMVQEINESVTESLKDTTKDKEVSGDIIGKGDYDWSQYEKAAKNPYFRENVPDHYVITVHLPGIQTIKEIDVQLRKRKVDFIYVDSEDGEPFFSIPTSYPILDEPIYAKYVRSKSTLTLHVKVEIPQNHITSASRDAVEEEEEIIRKEEEASRERIKKQQEKMNRLQSEEEEVMTKRKEWLKNMNAVAEGLLPPSLTEEIDKMPKDQQNAMLLRVERKIMNGDTIDEMLTKLPKDALNALAIYIRGKLQLEIPEHLKPKVIDGQTKAKDNNTQSAWEEKLDNSSDTVEFNFAKKAEKLFGVELHNRYLFALDH